MGGLLFWYSEKETGRGPSPPRPLFAVPNVTASVPITVLLYNGPLRSGFNVPIKGLNANAGLYATAISFCLFVCYFVR